MVFMSWRCVVYGQKNGFFGKVENFHEFELNVEGLNNKKMSLDDVSSIDHPQIKYQYFVNLLNLELDATHYIKFHTIPFIIHFQLKWCVSSLECIVEFYFENYFKWFACKKNGFIYDD